MTHIRPLIVAMAVCVVVVSAIIIPHFLHEEEFVTTLPFEYQTIDLESIDQVDITSWDIMVDRTSAWFYNGRAIYSYNHSTKDLNVEYDMIWWWDEFNYDSGVRAFTIDEYNLWVVNGEGVTAINRTTGSFLNYTLRNIIPGTSIISLKKIVVDESFACIYYSRYAGELDIITLNRSQGDWTAQNLHSYSTEISRINDIELHKDKVWMATNVGVLCFNITEQKLYANNVSNGEWELCSPHLLENKTPATALTLWHDELWIGLSDGNITYHDTQQNRWYFLDTKGKFSKPIARFSVSSNFIIIDGYSDHFYYERENGVFQEFNISLSEGVFYGNQLWGMNWENHGNLSVYTITVRTVQTRVTQEWLDANVSVPVLMVEGEARQ